MRYGRLSVADINTLRSLVLRCSEQAADGAIWWEHRRRAAAHLHDRPLALYAEHRAADARDAIAECRAWLDRLDQLRPTPPVRLRTPAAA